MDIQKIVVAKAQQFKKTWLVKTEENAWVRAVQEGEHTVEAMDSMNRASKEASFAAGRAMDYVFKDAGLNYTAKRKGEEEERTRAAYYKSKKAWSVALEKAAKQSFYNLKSNSESLPPQLKEAKAVWEIAKQKLQWGMKAEKALVELNKATVELKKAQANVRKSPLDIPQSEEEWGKAKLSWLHKFSSAPATFPDHINAAWEKVRLETSGLDTSGIEQADKFLMSSIDVCSDMQRHDSAETIVTCVKKITGENWSLGNKATESYDVSGIVWEKAIRAAFYKKAVPELDFAMLRKLKTKSDADYLRTVSEKLDANWLQYSHLKLSEFQTQLH